MKKKVKKTPPISKEKLKKIKAGSESIVIIDSDIA